MDNPPMKIVLADTAYRPKLEPLILRRIPSVEFAYVTPNGEVHGSLDGAEVFIAWGLEGRVIEPVIKQIDSLRWFHLMSAGVNDLMFPSMRDSDIVLTNARGIFAVPIAESVLAVMLLVSKKLRENFAHAKVRHWERLPRQELKGQTAGIYGFGAIGNEVAKRLKCFEMNVIGLKRKPHKPPSIQVDALYGSEGLNEFLHHSDWVIVCSALTPETHLRFGAAEFEVMKPEAWFVNIARGEIADEEALLDAINNGWIAGACLDAFTQEPLPKDSPFWEHPRIVMTPHNSSNSPKTAQRSLDLVMDNLERYLTGKPLNNIVDKQAGY
jgi:phosphoglycerate dehydrogenase-like enzyme